MTFARAPLGFVVAMLVLLGGTTRLASAANRDDAPSLVVRGAGPSVVLLSGLLGGTARLEPLADRLVAAGFRVLIVDPYRLAVHADDVSFHGLAREVAEVLRREGAQASVVVAHAHAAGIAIRLAANAPDLVSDAILLDAGVVAATRSNGVTRSLHLASFIARLPGGSSLIRSRLVSGMRANSGDPAWLTDAITRAYADPMLAALPAATRMATRLSAAVEPEEVGQLLRRVRANVTALLGAAPHGFSATPDEVALLQHLPGSQLRRLPGVGHFVHEEAPEAVVGEVLALRARRALALQ